jgi:AcrR family transcriptional regulator
MRSTSTHGGVELNGAKRGHLFEAMLLALAKRGYEGMVVEDVLVRSGTSQAEFDAAFGDKDACLFAAYEHFTDRLLATTTERCQPGEEWPLRIQQGLEALLGELAAQPQMAQVVMRSFPAIRPAAHARYMSFLEAFAGFFTEGREFAGVPEGLPAQVEMLAVGAAEAIVFDEVHAGRAAELRKLMPAILFSVLVPFLGPERAATAWREASGS